MKNKLRNREVSEVIYMPIREFHYRIMDFIGCDETKTNDSSNYKVFFVRSYRRSSGRWNWSDMRLKTSIEPLFNRVSVCNICGRSIPNYNVPLLGENLDEPQN